MSQQEIRPTPPPWSLCGSGYIFLLNLSDDQLRRLQPSASRGYSFLSKPIMMLVDYTYSNIGAYQELLFIPGRIETDMGSHWHISKIFVSTRDSVISGRENWGIPKELADFQFNEKDERGHHISVSFEGKTIIDLNMTYSGFYLPVTTSLLPPSFFSFYQELNAHKYIFAPSAHGKSGLAKVESARVDAMHFPIFDEQSISLAFRIHEFSLIFPRCDLILPLQN